MNGSTLRAMQRSNRTPEKSQRPGSGSGSHSAEKIEKVNETVSNPSRILMPAGYTLGQRVGFIAGLAALAVGAGEALIPDVTSLLTGYAEFLPRFRSASKRHYLGQL